jgi:hypothetical protein
MIRGFRACDVSPCLCVWLPGRLRRNVCRCVGDSRPIAARVAGADGLHSFVVTIDLCAYVLITLWAGKYYCR